jgi:hypothetical protein
MRVQRQLGWQAVQHELSIDVQGKNHNRSRSPLLIGYCWCAVIPCDNTHIAQQDIETINPGVKCMINPDPNSHGELCECKEGYYGSLCVRVALVMATQLSASL